MQPFVSFLRDTKSKGVISELTVMVALARAGYRLLVPYGENCRYDVAIEKNGVFQRVQIKTGRLRNGVVLFNAYSSHYHRRGVTRTYQGDVDFFGVFVAEIGEVYLIPAEVLRTSGSLRSTHRRTDRREGSAGPGSSALRPAPRVW
jgi:hypothetical protein